MNFPGSTIHAILLAKPIPPKGSVSHQDALAL
jgi:hypothetical protein